MLEAFMIDCEMSMIIQKTISQYFFMVVDSLKLLIKPVAPAGTQLLLLLMTTNNYV